MFIKFKKVTINFENSSLFNHKYNSIFIFYIIRSSILLINFNYYKYFFYLILYLIIYLIIVNL